MAVDGLSDFLTLYDSEDRLILANRAAREINSEIAESLEPGRTYEDYIRAGIASGLFPGDGTVVDDDWIADRLRRHRESAGPFETVHRDGRWYLVNKQRVVDGMTLTIGTDITEQKRQSLRVETLNAELRVQIAETEQARARMRQAKELAEAASRAKSEFLSHMSHELRTPLNAVLGFAQLLQADAEATMSEDQKTYLDFIISGGRHLLTLINDVLDLSRIESGKLELTVKPVRPADIYRDCLAMLEPLSEKHHINVTNRVGDAGEVAIVADPTRLKQVFLNIVSNAIKYNRRGGSVTVTAGPAAPGMMRVSVADSGRGIASERHADVFQPFSRLLDDSAEIEGTGIGLAISRHLIDMMHGGLDFESELGIGSTFWFDLPIAGQD